MLETIPPRTRWWLIMSAAAGMIIAIWLTAALVGWDEERVLDWIPDSRALAAVIIVALLVADTVLPIPATLVMLGSGVLLGPVAGTALNATGLLLAALGGYGIGALLPDHTAAVATRAPAHHRRFALVAVTRGLPVLSESYAIGAGALRFPLRPFVGAAGLGAITVGTVYGVAGWLATDHWSLILVAAALAAGAYLAAVGVGRSVAAGPDA